MTAASPLARYRAVDGALPSGSAAPSYTITGDTTAGVYRSERTISRYCENGALDCFKEQLPSGAMGYFINRESIQDRIIELKQLAASGHGAPGRDLSEHDATRQDTSGHDETEAKALKQRVEQAEKERDELRDENMQLKIDVGVRRELLKEAKRMTDHMMGERDLLMRHLGALEGQVRQLGAAPVDSLTRSEPEVQVGQQPENEPSAYQSD